jgi:cold-inducible RNA-binding protein
MGKRLYIGSLSYDSTDDSLKNHFSKVGTVESSSVVMDKMSGRSRGFGFVEMSTDDEAAKAVDELNGTDLDGRKIIVNEARPMTDRPPRRNFGGGDRGGFGGGGHSGGGF